METINVSFFPDNNTKVLNNLFYRIIDMIDESYKAALFGDLNLKYLQSTRLIKTSKNRFHIVNTIHRKFKSFKAKISMKERLYQRMADTEKVESILFDSSYKIGNFEWRVESNAPDDSFERALLADCLKDYDKFIEAINDGVISIVSTVNIHDEIKIETEELNSVVMKALEKNQISFYKDKVNYKALRDEDISDLISKYKYALSKEEDDEDGIEYGDSEEMYDIYDYFVQSYLNELRNITFRLYNIYLYFQENGINLMDIDYEGEVLFQRLFHFYTLEDNKSNMRIDDDYLSEYDDLSQFYRLYIYNLRLALVEVLEECKCEDSNLPRNNDLRDYDDLTKRLILSIKNSKKQ